MPRFRARVKGMIDSDLLRAVKDTLLIQFAQYVGDTLDGEASPTVSRCEGLIRTTAEIVLAVDAHYPEEMERRWREEIAALSGQAPGVPDIQRCHNLCTGNGKTHFCSDACRFATQQLAQQVTTPGDLNAKQQRRYRRRQKQAETL